MIEQRRLTEKELNLLIDEAPENEKRNFMEFLGGEITPYDYLDNFAIDHFGVIVDARPIYMAALVPNHEGINEFITIANSNIKNYFSLCKLAKKELVKWVEKYGDIYATMEKVNPQNQKWTEWLGFLMDMDEENIVTYVIRKGQSIVKEI